MNAPMTLRLTLLAEKRDGTPFTDEEWMDLNDWIGDLVVSASRHNAIAVEHMMTEREDRELGPVSSARRSAS